MPEAQTFIATQNGFSGLILSEFIDPRGVKVLEVFIPELFLTVMMDLEECIIETKTLH